MVYPFEITQPEGELADKFPEIKYAFSLVGPKKFVVLTNILDKIKEYYDFKARPDDIWLYGFPRSGTTLTEEIVWLIENNLDFKKANEEVLDLRFPILERETTFEHIKLDTNGADEKLKSIARRLQEPAPKVLEEMQGKRLIKTHLPLSLGPSNILESGCKIVYVARNPKDVIPSMYNLQCSFDMMYCDFDKFWQCYEAGFDYLGPIFEHIKEGWALRHHKNVLFVLYEDLNKNLRKTLIKIADFLGKSLTDQQLDQLEEHLKIDNFRNNKSVNNDHLKQLKAMKDEFIRNGKVNSGKDYFTGPLAERVDKWFQKNLEGSDLTFTAQL